AELEDAGSLQGPAPLPPGRSAPEDRVGGLQRADGRALPRLGIDRRQREPEARPEELAGADAPAIAGLVPRRGDPARGAAGRGPGGRDRRGRIRALGRGLQRPRFDLPGVRAEHPAGALREAMTYRRRTTCRGCGGERLRTLLDFGKMPLANALLRAREDF